MEPVNPIYAFNAKHALTYNAVYDAFGEEVMLAYENIVGEYIEGRPAREVDLIILSVRIAKADKWNTASSDISIILTIAKQHAQQEIDESVANDFSAYVNMDLQSILD